MQAPEECAAVQGHLPPLWSLSASRGGGGQSTRSICKQSIDLLYICHSKRRWNSPLEFQYVVLLLSSSHPALITYNKKPKLSLHKWLANHTGVSLLLTIEWSLNRLCDWPILAAAVQQVRHMLHEPRIVLQRAQHTPLVVSWFQPLTTTVFKLTRLIFCAM